MVKTAATFEKEGRKMRGLRTSKQKVSAEESLQEKLVKYLIGKLSDTFRDKDDKLSFTLILGTIAGIFIASQLLLLCLSLASSHESGRELLSKGTQYITADSKKTIELTSVSELNMRAGGKTSKNISFKVFSNNWRDVAPLMTSSVFDKENWVLELGQGIQDLDGIVYYHADAPELAIVHQMNEVVSTANNYYKERQNYPKNIRQISERSFRFLNPFTKEMDFPNIRSVTFTEPQSPETNAFFKQLRKGAHWPGELDFYPGAMECCRVLYQSSPTDQNFVAHVCDRNGVVIKDSQGHALLLKSLCGVVEQEEPKAADQQLRDPTIWVLRAPPELVPIYLAILKYRFVAMYGMTTMFLLAMNWLLRNTDARPLALLLLALSCMMLAASAIGAYAP